MNEFLKRTWAEVNLDAIAENFHTIKALAGGKRIMSVVKADAYGHGAVPVAKKLAVCGTDFFAVADADEAVQLAKNAIKVPILILGATPPDSFHILARYGFAQAVTSEDYARRLSAFAVANGTRLIVHIKIDTGMARLGLDCRCEGSIPSAADAAERIARLPGLYAQGLFTHFAISEKQDNSFTGEQLARYSALSGELLRRGVDFEVRHASNSGAIVNFPQARFDMVRPGIILYGIPTSEDNRRLFRPAMAIKSQISEVRFIETGESVSYCRTYFAPSRRRVAVIPVGYADGIPTTYSNRGRVLIGGKSAPIVGRVCMDQMMVDVTDLPEVKPWQEAVVLGGELTADEIAGKCGIISYEVVCGIGKRITRVYLENGEITETYNSIL